MSQDPTRALLLFGLLARHGECAQAELMPAVRKADREALAKAGLIAVGKPGRGFRLTLTDAGWAWAAAHLAAELPPAQRALADLLARLGEHLARSGDTLADVIGAKPALPAEPEAAAAATRTSKSSRKAPAAAPTKAAAAKPRKAASAGRTEPTKAGASKAGTSKAGASKGRGKAPTQAALRDRIEAAYLALTHGRRDEAVRLARLRAALADLDRSTLDAALARILKGDAKAALMRHDDPRQLDQADHDAAFDPGGEPFHVIWIAS